MTIDDTRPFWSDSSADLGPLPEARWLWAGNGPRPYEDAFSADQMRAYAAHEVAAERERLATTLMGQADAAHKAGNYSKRDQLSAAAGWVLKA